MGRHSSGTVGLPQPSTPLALPGSSFPLALPLFLVLLAPSLSAEPLALPWSWRGCDFTFLALHGLVPFLPPYSYDSYSFVN